MKVFVYLKSNSKRVCVLNDVECVKTDKTKGVIIIYTKNSSDTMEFDTKTFKTSVFQN